MFLWFIEPPEAFCGERWGRPHVPLVADDLRYRKHTCRAGVCHYNNYSSMDEGRGASAWPAALSLLLTV